MFTSIQSASSRYGGGRVSKLNELWLIYIYILCASLSPIKYSPALLRTVLIITEPRLSYNLICRVISPVHVRRPAWWRKVPTVGQWWVGRKRGSMIDSHVYITFKVDLDLYSIECPWSIRIKQNIRSSYICAHSQIIPLIWILFLYLKGQAVTRESISGWYDRRHQIGNCGVSPWSANHTRSGDLFFRRWGWEATFHLIYFPSLPASPSPPPSIISSIIDLTTKNKSSGKS